MKKLRGSLQEKKKNLDSTTKAPRKSIMLKIVLKKGFKVDALHWSDVQMKNNNDTLFS